MTRPTRIGWHTTATLAEAAAGLVLAAELRDGRAVVAEAGGTEPWQPRILPAQGRVARVALVQSRASVLAGDQVTVRVDVDRDAALEIVELGATIANNVRGGRPATLDVVVRLAVGARLVWLAQPLIASAGCALDREMLVALEAGAVALLGESIVLGRHGEEPGRVRSRTRITLDGRPLVDETFATEPAWLLRSAVVGGDARMIEAFTLAGLRDDAPPEGAFQAHEPATLWRGLGPADAGLPGLAERWRGLALAEAGPPLLAGHCRRCTGRS